MDTEKFSVIDRIALGKRIKDCRTSKKWTQQKLGEKCDINHSYIFGQVLKSSQMPVKPYFMGVPGSFHIRHSSRIFSHLGIS